MTIDVSSVLNSLLQVAGLIILTVGGVFASMIAAKLKAKYGIEVSAAQKAELEDAATKSVTWGITKSQSEIAANGWDHFQTQNQIVALAANYAIEQFPGVMANAGLDISTPDAKAKTADTLAYGIMRRVLPNAVSSAAASPATPPARADAPIATVTNLTTAKGT